MAEAFLNRLAKGKAIATSAGTSPASNINPGVIKVMLEVGIDISHQRPEPLKPKMLERVDRVITMGCSVEEVCPTSFITTEDWELEDPEGKPLDRVRQIRDEIKARVQVLIKELRPDSG